MKPSPRHGFAGTGQAVDGGDEVEIDGADDGDHEAIAGGALLLYFVRRCIYSRDCRGAAHIVVNNAAIYHSDAARPAETVELDYWHNVLSVASMARCSSPGVRPDADRSQWGRHSSSPRPRPPPTATAARTAPRSWR